MRRSLIIASFLVAAVAALAACQPSDPVKPTPVQPATPLTSPSQAPPASPAVSPSMDDKKPIAKAEALVGQWHGLDGAALKVEMKGDKYEIEIKAKDGSKKFEGTVKGDVIEFTRNGKTETIKTATLEETGMKWLKGEKTCVVINKGTEAYCKS